MSKKLSNPTNEKLAEVADANIQISLLIIVHGLENYFESKAGQTYGTEMKYQRTFFAEIIFVLHLTIPYYKQHPDIQIDQHGRKPEKNDEQLATKNVQVASLVNREAFLFPLTLFQDFPPSSFRYLDISIP